MNSKTICSKHIYEVKGSPIGKHVYLVAKCVVCGDYKKKTIDRWFK